MELKNMFILEAILRKRYIHIDPNRRYANFWSFILDYAGTA